MADAELGQVTKQSEYLQEPQNHGDHYNAVQDSLDLTLHGNEAVNQPHQHSDHEECKYNGYKRHIVFSFSCLARCVFQKASATRALPFMLCAATGFSMRRPSELSSVRPCNSQCSSRSSVFQILRQLAVLHCSP